PNPPSRHEAEAALAGSPPPEKQSRHKRRAGSVAVAPAAPVREEPPSANVPAVPERHSSKSGNGASSAKSGKAAASDPHPAVAPVVAPENQPATGSSTPAAEPSKPPEKRHSRAKHVATGTSVPPPARGEQAQPAAKPEIKWVNPAPSR